MKGNLEKYDKVDSGWIVRYRTDRGMIIVYQHVMLHPNQVNYAEQDKEVEFRIESCPNLQNGGEWEDMAIIETGEAKRISEIIEKFKDKEMFPKLNAHAREMLANVKWLPNPNDKPIVYNEDELFQILMDFVEFSHDHMEPRGSIITRFLEELKNKK